jgi:hypothetical protein
MDVQFRSLDCFRKLPQAASVQKRRTANNHLLREWAVPDVEMDPDDAARKDNPKDPTVRRRLSEHVRHDSTWVAATWWLQRIEQEGRVMALGHAHLATDLDSRRRPPLPVGTAAFIELLNDPAKPRSHKAISGVNGAISFLFARGNRKHIRKTNGRRGDWQNRSQMSCSATLKTPNG